MGAVAVTASAVLVTGGTAADASTAVWVESPSLTIPAAKLGHFPREYFWTLQCPEGTYIHGILPGITYTEENPSRMEISTLRPNAHLRPTAITWGITNHFFQTKEIWLNLRCEP
jgi:hypothetical protein